MLETVEYDDDTAEDIKNLINYPELIHKFPSNGKYLYGRPHILPPHYQSLFTNSPPSLIRCMKVLVFVVARCP